MIFDSIGMFVEIATGDNISNVFSKMESREMALVGLRKKPGFVASRIALKHALRRYFFEKRAIWLPISVIEIMSRKSMSPTWRINGKNEFDPSVSVSHSGRVGVAAVSDDKLVGIDIESVRAFPSVFKTFFLTERERRFLDGFFGFEQHEKATALWCIKEAYLKAIGTGLRKHPLEVEVNFGNRIAVFDRGIRISADIILQTGKRYVLAIVTI